MARPSGSESVDTARIRAALTAPGSPFELGHATRLGRDYRVWLSQPPDLLTLLDLSREYGERDFLVYEGERVSYGEHYRLAATLAHRLDRDFGVGEGDRVAIAMRNYPEWSIAFFATVAAGAIAVPLNAWWTPRELAHGLTDSGARVLIADHERIERCGATLAERRMSGIVVRPRSPLPDGIVDMATLLETATTEVTRPDIAVDPDDDATIFYTSGTTGVAKGVLGTHYNATCTLMGLRFGRAVAAIAGGMSLEELTGGTEPAVLLLSVPLFHATGCFAFLLGTFATGGTVVLMYKWDPEHALELIERERVTSYGGGPTMAAQVLASPGFAETDTSSLLGVGYGGAPAPPSLVNRISARLPAATASTGYGLTETSALAISNMGIDYVRRPDSVGRPVPIVDVGVVDPSGAPVATGEVGELVVRGPNVVKGYWNRPEETARTIIDGWLHTGDLARIDGEGFVSIVDRAKDMIIRGGENVYCAEVEAALHEHPAVADCAVIGVPHDELGEEVGALIRPVPGSGPNVGEVRDFLSGRIAAFKIPSVVWFQEEELPRNPGGKLLKTVLRARLLGAE